MEGREEKEREMRWGFLVNDEDSVRGKKASERRSQASQLEGAR